MTPPHRVIAGRIAAAELYVAVLLLSHRINSWPLGGGLKKPPSRCVAVAHNAQ